MSYLWARRERKIEIRLWIRLACPVNIHADIYAYWADYWSDYWTIQWTLSNGFHKQGRETIIKHSLESIGKRRTIRWNSGYPPEFAIGKGNERMLF